MKMARLVLYIASALLVELLVSHPDAETPESLKLW
jgi:hypothetical protein